MQCRELAIRVEDVKLGIVLAKRGARVGTACIVDGFDRTLAFTDDHCFQDAEQLIAICREVLQDVDGSALVAEDGYQIDRRHLRSQELLSGRKRSKLVGWAHRGHIEVERKQAAVNAALLRHATHRGDPLHIAMTVGGRELAAILGAVVAARLQKIPVLLDGFVCTAAAAPLARLVVGGLDHARAAHVSAEAGHRLLLEALRLNALLDLGMRLGEGSGAALAIPILRASIACHRGMATFSEAGVQDRD